jgi:hypothetical protein
MCKTHITSPSRIEMFRMFARELAACLRGEATSQRRLAACRDGCRPRRTGRLSLTVLQVRLDTRRACQRWAAPHWFRSGAKAASKHNGSHHLCPGGDIAAALPDNASNTLPTSSAAST